MQQPNRYLVQSPSSERVTTPGIACEIPNNNNNNNNNNHPIFSRYIVTTMHYVSSIGAINISLQHWPACRQNKLLIA
jgi:hypothetical protein